MNDAAALPDDAVCHRPIYVPNRTVPRLAHDVPLPVRKRWTAKLPRPSGECTIVPCEGHLLVGSDRSDLQAISAETGELLWGRTVPDRAKLGGTLGGEPFLLGRRHRTATLLSPDGQPGAELPFEPIRMCLGDEAPAAWPTFLGWADPDPYGDPSRVPHFGAASEGVGVCVVSANSGRPEASGWDLATGERLWTVTLDGCASVGEGPVAGQGVVLLPVGGELWCVGLRDGRVRWRCRPGSGRRGPRCWFEPDRVVLPLYVEEAFDPEGRPGQPWSVRGRIGALDLETGAELEGDGVRIDRLEDWLPLLGRNGSRLIGGFHSGRAHPIAATPGQVWLAWEVELFGCNKKRGVAVFERGTSELLASFSTGGDVSALGWLSGGMVLVGGSTLLSYAPKPQRRPRQTSRVSTSARR